MDQEKLSVEYHKRTLPGGTTVIVIPRSDTRLVALNLLYRVGSRNESPDMTGLAHLMEHLMFSGTEKYPQFDIPITKLGGLNNAFTNQDVTNYYTVVPAEYLSLAMELEADRLFNLNISEEKVEVQKSVVIEEFRQRYLNQPYGDLNHHLLDAAFKKHHYRWPTIGLKPDHIESATPEDVATFFKKHYNPANLILVIAGNVTPEAAFDLADEHFGIFSDDKSTISPGMSTVNIPQEPLLNRRCRKILHRKVPASLVVIAYPVPAISHPDYVGFGFIADILGQGIISRLHIALVRDQKLFTRVSAGVTGTFDPGLFTISAVLHDSADPESATENIEEVIRDFTRTGPVLPELNSVIHGMITSTLFKRQQVASLALEFALAEFEEDAAKANRILSDYRRIDGELLAQLTGEFLVSQNRIEIQYLKE